MLSTRNSLKIEQWRWGESEIMEKGIFHDMEIKGQDNLFLYQIKQTLKQRLQRTSLVAQWLRIHLAVQGTRLQSLIKELRSHTPQSNKAHELHLLSLHILEPMCHNWRAHETQLLSPPPQHDAAMILRAATKTRCSSINK